MEGRGACLVCDTLSKVGWNLISLSTAGNKQRQYPTFTFVKSMQGESKAMKTHLVVYMNKKRQFEINCGYEIDRDEAMKIISDALQTVDLFKSMKGNVISLTKAKWESETVLPLVLYSALQTTKWKLCSEYFGTNGKFMMMFEKPTEALTQVQMALRQQYSSAPVDGLGPTPLPNAPPPQDDQFLQANSAPSFPSQSKSYSEAPVLIEDASQSYVPSSLPNKHYDAFEDIGVVDPLPEEEIHVKPVAPEGFVPGAAPAGALPLPPSYESLAFTADGSPTEGEQSHSMP